MTRSPDVAFFLPSAGGCGAERVIITIVERLAERGYAVDLLLGESKAADVDYSLSGVNIIGFDRDRLSLCVRPLAKYLRKSEPGAIVSTIYISNIIVALSHLASRSNTHLVLRIANTPSEHISSSAPRHVIGRRLLPFAYGRADEIIAISSGVKRDLVESFSVPPEKISIVHNPIDLESVNQQASQTADHPWVQSENDDLKIILGMGRLTPQKDFTTLIRAFTRVQNRRENTRLIILGNGELRSELDSLTHELGVAELVEFPGYVNNPFPYLANADLFVLSSAWEGFGNVLVEALACGCPVVSTDCPSGPREILADGEFGQLVPIGDVGAMANAIEVTLDEEVNETKLRSRAEDFDVEEIVVQYESLIFKGNL